MAVLLNMMMMNKNKQSPLFSLITVMLFDHTSLNITFPVLTLLFFDLQSSLFTPDTPTAVRSMWYGYCIALPHLINLITTPFLSMWSDEFGRKKILLLGTFGAFLFAFTAAVGIVGGMLSWVFLGRLIQGAFSRTNPIAQAVIGDISTPQQKIIRMGYLQTAISIGAFVGPIIGGYFAHSFLFSTLNFSLPYWIAALFALISWLLTIVLFKETLVVNTFSKSPKLFNLSQLKHLFFQPKVSIISLILLFSQMSWSLYYQFIPPILKNVFYFNAHQLGVFIGFIALWLALATAFGIKALQHRLTAYQLLKIALYLVFFGLVFSCFYCLWYTPDKGSLVMWLTAIPIATGDVIAYSCLISFYSNAVSHYDQGKVMGICFCVVAITWAATGLCGGWLMAKHIVLPLIIAPLGILFAIRLMPQLTRQSLI